jgi:hypothetical protein
MSADRELLHSTLYHFVSPHDKNLGRTVGLIYTDTSKIICSTISCALHLHDNRYQTFKFKLPLVWKEPGTDKTAFLLLCSYSLCLLPHYEIRIVCQIISNSPPPSARRNVTMAAQIMYATLSFVLYFFRKFRFSQKDIPTTALNPALYFSKLTY